ncbi:MULTISPECIES: hypothetical protein [Acidithiobacillus]|uniref:Uncharacterized protein n=2 Tax=Acidithiobacillus TaxID=119977 RepID=A0A179BML2_ACIFR|nr:MULTISPECIES: hypothetical protein [Acidithiobacillus]MEB8476678.1 hypothetical protein [Acidithiobacillus ferriphilus]MEB8485997.1 hypothetical protein [Acidithiobacillus ferriphilus]MEB8489598.1 hypothetical protein [Acidithiobacillus ferriphilus]MEB8492483.1 hypothetical protein [Acidithiobacillus ferriphilus]MEB8515422.1 hypothetical protein [Acidithiobacillus ferriphilus]
MERTRRIMNKYNMVSWTSRSKTQMDSLLDVARKLQDDPEWAQRIAAGLCRLCHYHGNRFGLAGAAMTQEPCMCCGKDQIYGSTRTDALCLECAKDTGLCKHCGGDRELQTGRRNWPEPKL